MRFDARLLNISKILDFFCSGEKFSSVVSTARTSETSLSLLNPFSKASPFLEALFDDFLSSNEVCFFDAVLFLAVSLLKLRCASSLSRLVGLIGSYEGSLEVDRVFLRKKFLLFNFLLDWISPFFAFSSSLKLVPLTGNDGDGLSFLVVLKSLLLNTRSTFLFEWLARRSSGAKRRCSSRRRIING